MDIFEITRVDDRTVGAFARLVPQLSARLAPPSREALERMAASPGVRLLAARTPDGGIVGLLSLAFYEVPSGRKAWIEDVVVDASARGCGVGRALLGEALSLARAEGAAKVLLTSNPARTAARRLYATSGFVRRGTDLFEYVL